MRRIVLPRRRALLPMFMLLFAAVAAASPGESPSKDMLPGVWAGMRDFGPEVAGQLAISREPSGWFAVIGSYRSDVTFEDGVLSFVLPGERGSFRGFLDAQTGRIYAQWVQPGAFSIFGQQFSTPVTLDPAGPARWTGDVQPLEDRVHIYLAIQSPRDGLMTAFLRNPEVNVGRFFDFRDVKLEGNHLGLWGTLSSRKNEASRTLMEGCLHESSGQLSLFIENLGGTYDLEKLSDEAVTDYLPRSWSRDRYRYRPPASRDDGWRTSDLQSVGMAIEPIEELVQTIITTPIEAIDSPWVDGVLIARHGKLVVEEYFHGYDANRTHDTRSASKSITSTIVGAAIRRGDVRLDSRVYEIMNDGTMPDDLDPRASRMTIEHLITMTSGLDCDDWNQDSTGGEDRMQNQSEQPDWHQYVLDLPMVHEPGEHPAYCSGGMSLAGGVVSKASGIPLTDYFDRFVARPLRMGTYHTNLMPNGEAYGGGGLRINGRDFLKFGQLILNDGDWNGRRILNRGWAREALKIRHDLGGERFGSYGYGWWLIDYERDGRSYHAFYAGGNGGNFIIGIPDLDLVIVFFASNYNQAVMNLTKLEYVPSFILRSVIEGDARSGRSPTR